MYLVTLFVAVLACTGCIYASTVMWYDSTDIIPLGNGRLGAQILGQIEVENIILNEDHIWSGSINDPYNSNCPAALPTVREHIWNDRLFEAQELVDNSCMATPILQQMFQTAGNLTIAMAGHESGSATLFNHTLDLSSAVSTTRYVFNGVEYTRTAFASHPDDVIVLRITANVSSSVGFNASFVTPMGNASYAAEGERLTVTGTGTVVATLPPSIRYQATAHVTASGTDASVTADATNARIIVSNADEALIIIAIDTNYIRYDDISGDPAAKVASTLAAATERTFEELLDTHIADHSALFSRVDISLGTPSSATYLPTSARIKFPQGADADADLFALYMQYGRYMTIASSRKTEPPNLQGIWNKDLSPSWGSKYTININQQMNHWLAEPLNLVETLDPLWNLMTEMAERGVENARVTYNITKGWIGHHNTGIWRDSAPIDAAFYGFWTLGTAWLAQNMYEHYEFNPDPTSPFVSEVAYPLMKGLSEFYLEFLVEDPIDEGNYLVTNPSASPEKGIADYNDTNVSMTYGSTIDNSLLRDLFNHTAILANALGIDSEFASTLMETHDRLMPFRIGSLGQLQEWAIDYNPGGVFTHISHLYPLFPGAQIDPRFNETLAIAANTSLTLRGDSGNGWPTAWRANCYARLLNGERAYYFMRRLLGQFSYSNLWSRNSVFQIDGNLGGANAVVEMILQSHNGEIHLLPAIPEAWSQGRVTGLRARGGFGLDVEWEGGVLVSANVTSTFGTFARARYSGSAIDLSFEKGQSQVLTPSSFGL